MSAVGDPRVHEHFAGELERLLDATRKLRAAGGQSAAQRQAAVIADELSILGWHVQPSHQRRHQIERGMLRL